MSHPARLGWIALSLLTAGCATRGGATGVAAPATAAPVVAPTPAAAGTCGDPALLFCEDFEAYPAGPATSARWKPRASSGSTLAIDATKRPGSKTLHVHTVDNGHAMMEVPFAPPDNSHFGRMRVWVDAFPTGPDWAHFTMVEASGADPGVVRPIGGQHVRGQGGRSFFGVGSDRTPSGDWTSWHLSSPTTSRAWLCLEWEMRAADNVVAVWIDGVARPELTVSTKKHGGRPVDFVFPKLDRIWFGWWLYQRGTQPPQFDVWIDDVALGKARIGC